MKLSLEQPAQFIEGGKNEINEMKISFTGHFDNVHMTLITINPRYIVNRESCVAACEIARAMDVLSIVTRLPVAVGQ